jgi:hypothetical protein
MSINVNEAHSDGEAVFEPSDGPNKIRMFRVLVDLQPVGIGMVYTSQVVTANGDYAFRDVEEDTDRGDHQEDGLNTL